MTDAIPSMRKNPISKRVREKAPLIGLPIITAPTAMARMPERRDHQKPGTPRARIVLNRPTSPLMRNNQPKKMVTARVATAGTITAAAPRQIKIIPSAR
jgi:hypothetical protein